MSLKLRTGFIHLSEHIKPSINVRIIIPEDIISSHDLRIEMFDQILECDKSSSSSLTQMTFTPSILEHKVRRQ